MLHDTCYILNATSYMLYATWNASDSWSSITRVFSLHNMRPITIHEFLKHMLAKASVGWSITYTTWLFWMHIPEWNASVGISLTSTTWVPLHYMNFLHVYTGMKRLWWSKASGGWSIACTTWVSFTLHGFFECIYRNQTTSWPISDLHYMRSITLHELFARV